MVLQVELEVLISVCRCLGNSQLPSLDSFSLVFKIITITEFGVNKDSPPPPKSDYQRLVGAFVSIYCYRCGSLILRDHMSI